MKLRAICYCRVSTDKQEDEGSSLDTQAENTQQYALEQGYTVILVVRETFTGSLYRERKDLSKIRQMARNHEFDVLIINTYDRLSRNQTHFAVLLDEMQHLKISVACVKEKLDDTPMGVFVRQTLGFVAEIERQKIIERTEDGRKKRIESGKMLTGNKPRYGYCWRDESKGEKGEYIIEQKESEVVSLIFTYFTTVKSSCNGVTTMLNERQIPTPRGRGVWERSVVYRILTDPFYIGKAYTRRFHNQALKPQKEWVSMPEGTIPAIIDEATFHKAQELLRINKQESLRNNRLGGEELLCCGSIKCGYCKRNMNVHRTLRECKDKKVIDSFYRCQYGNRGNTHCSHAPMIDSKRADKAVWDYVGELIQDFSLVEQAIEIAKGRVPSYSNLQSIEQSIKNAQFNHEQLVEDLAQKEDGVFKLKGRARQLVMNELEKVEQYLGKLEIELGKVLSGHVEWEAMQEELEKFIAWCLNGRILHPSATLEEKRTVLRNLGLIMYIYKRGDTDHKQYEIRIGIPDLCDVVLQSC